MNNIELARENMLKQQLRTCAVVDKSVLNLLSKSRRERFVPEAHQPFAYADMQIPIGHDQTMMTPLEEAQILQALQIQSHETVLEIGTGTGYLTSLLAQQAKKVLSIDIYPAFTAQATERLEAAGLANVECLTGDAYRGWLDAAPYDVIVSTGSHPQLPGIFSPQLLSSGRMFVILGKSPAMRGELLRPAPREQGWHHSLVFETDIAPLILRGDRGEFVF